MAMMLNNMIAITFDLSLNQLLEKGIAVFFAVAFFFMGMRELRALRRSFDAQTLSMHDCFLWLGSLIRADKKIPPPTSPGLPGFHGHRRSDDTPPVPPIPPGGPTTGYPTPKPFSPPGKK
jgi:hypothetical protein